MTHLDWTKIGLNNISGTAGNKKVYCPQCHANRNDKGDKSLSINLETGVYNCHYCGFSGSVAETDLSTVRKQTKFYKRPVEREAKPLSEKLLTWFAGRGISKDTLTLARISEGLEFMPQKGKEANTLQFNFYLNGELINTKFRTGDKNFKLVSGARLIPWNIDAIKDQQSCIITEGEIDALSFIECGFLNSVSVPNGASKNLDYLDDFIESHFDDKESIYIAVDTDTKGVQLKDELLRRFGVERCRVIDYGEGCKDANEHLQKFGKESLANLIHNAPEPTMEGVYSIYDFETNLDALFENGLQKGFTIGHENFNALCSFETKRLAVVTGVPGCLTGDALVSMADGSQKPIKDVQVGDNVLSFDSGFNCVSRKVNTKWDCGKKEVYKIKFNSGQVLQSSSIHKYLTLDGWKEAKELQRGDMVLSKNKTKFWVFVRSIEILDAVPMYDLEVEETHNFIANNIVVHNSGKSEFIDEICEHLNIIHDWRVAYFSPENAPLAYHASKLIEKLTGKKFCKEKLPNNEYKQVKEHIQNNFFFIAPHEDFKIDTILERAKFLVRRKGIKVLVIDPYNRLENEMGNRNESLYISSVLDKLTTFAQINDVLVILMAHPTKMQRGKDGVQEIPTLYDISGSANFYNKADFGIIVHRDRQNELVEVRVQKVKFRHLGEPGVAKFKYNINNGRFVPYIDDLRPIEWDNSNHLQTKIEEQIEYQNRMQNGLFDKDDICPF